VSASRFKQWLKPVSGFAVAASVALVAIMVVAPQPGQVAGEHAPATVVQANKPFVSPDTVVVAPASQAVSYSPSQQVNTNRLNAYLLRHNQMARTAGRQGFVSFVPIVATPMVSASEAGDGQLEPDRAAAELETAERK
jgi:negative regulator of sigma E activity